jgi:hypothetical protein
MYPLKAFDKIIEALSRDEPDSPSSFSLKLSTTMNKEFIRRIGAKQEVGCTTDKFSNFRFTGPSVIAALYLARASLEVLMDANESKILKLDTRSLLSLYNTAKDWPEDKFVSYAKYTTAWPMARYLNNNLPEKPEGFTGHPTGYRGSVKRFLKSRLVTHSNPNAALFFSLLQSVKRGAADIPEVYIDIGLEKHKTLLGAKPILDEHYREKFTNYSVRFWSEFQAEEPVLHEPTTSASMQATGGGGGTCEKVMRADYGEQLFESMGTSSTLEQMIYCPRSGKLTEVHGPYIPTFEEALATAWSSPTGAKIIPLREALKLRIISKGDAYRYWVAKDFQKQLWRYLQRFPCFRLTGKTFTGFDMYELDELTSKIEAMTGLPCPDWVSGDYSAATDRLNLDVTKIFLEEALTHVDDIDGKYKDVLRSVLYEQELFYPDKSTCTQTNGQLMGSVLSFPILCAINLCTYWMSLEEVHQREFNMRELPVLVNGDDILFKSDEDDHESSLYGTWKRAAASAGFLLSLGKNYIHKQYLTVNSKLFSDIGSGETKRHFREIPYYNLKTAMGKRNHDSPMKPIWDLYRETIAGSANIRRAHARFFYYNAKEIKKVTLNGQLNWFASTENGGIGCLPTRGVKISFTNFQRRLASLLRSRPTEGPAPQRATISVEVQDKLITDDYVGAYEIVPFGPLRSEQMRDRGDNTKVFRRKILCTDRRNDSKKTILRVPRLKSLKRGWDEVEQPPLYSLEGMRSGHDLTRVLKCLNGPFNKQSKFEDCVQEKIDEMLASPMGIPLNYNPHSVFSDEIVESTQDLENHFEEMKRWFQLPFCG